ncbi:MAG TPA: hypothetical protein VIV84_05200 [Burkholderiaceae bacterium]
MLDAAGQAGRRIPGEQRHPWPKVVRALFQRCDQRNRVDQGRQRIHVQQILVRRRREGLVRRHERVLCAGAGKRVYVAITDDAVFSQAAHISH